jgi:hypothetical protein
MKLTGILSKVKSLFKKAYDPKKESRDDLIYDDFASAYQAMGQKGMPTPIFARSEKLISVRKDETPGLSYGLSNDEFVRLLDEGKWEIDDMKDGEHAVLVKLSRRFFVGWKAESENSEIKKGGSL